MKLSLLRLSLIGAPVLLAAWVSAVADQPASRAVLQSAAGRKAAPDFVLQDDAGKSATLQEYRGKVVLLDFWATWCHGCKLEIPWFSEFQKTYGKSGLAVVGVSMDEGGWKVLKPFLENAKIPYRMVLGNDQIYKRYGLQSLPDTFLIDRQGRLAAAYTNGLVDRANVEANIQALLAQH